MDSSFFDRTVHPYIRKVFINFLIQKNIYAIYLRGINMNIIKAKGGLKEDDFFTFLMEIDNITNSTDLAERYLLIQYQTKWIDALKQARIELIFKKRKSLNIAPNRRTINITSLLMGRNFIRSMFFNPATRNLEIVIEGMFGPTQQYKIAIDATVDYVDVVNNTKSDFVPDTGVIMSFKTS